MDGLADLRMFSEIARWASMSVAASRLGMSPATISGRLKAMEEHYGVSLVRRTTRSLSLTDEGNILLQRAQTVLDGYTDLERALCGARKMVHGSLVISSAADLGRNCVVPLVAAFSRLFPDASFQLQFDQDQAAGERSFDLAFRVGPLRDSTLITRKLGDVHMMTCASPDYLARYGLPASPMELVDHHCLLHLNSASRSDMWAYKYQGRLEPVAVSAIHSASDIGALVDLARRGHGVVRTSDHNVADAVHAGDLVPILADFEPDPQGLHLLSDSRRLLPLRTAQFIDFTVEHFRRASTTNVSLPRENDASNRQKNVTTSMA